MLQSVDKPSFRPINRAYNSVFKPNRLSLGLVVPLENHASEPVPTMARHAERVQLAEALGFSAVWLRDVPFNVPSFGDAGQVYDPFVYLGYLAARTRTIGLGVASIILPLRHPAHVAKAAASADQLSDGRLLLGVASGDRPEEYPAMNVPFEQRGERFRESYTYIRQMAGDAARFDNLHGHPGGGIDLLPKPATGRLPLLITGASQQDPDWLARNGDGWMTYPRSTPTQAQAIHAWRARISEVGQTDKPVMQPLYVDLADRADTAPQPIHLGFRTGTDYLLAYLKSMEKIGINHVAINLRFNRADIETTLQRLADDILPEYSPEET